MTFKLFVTFELFDMCIEINELYNTVESLNVDTPQIWTLVLVPIVGGY